MRSEFRCADASEDRSEPMFATASYVRDWLLIEQPGGWGHDPATQSRMHADLGRAIVNKARGQGVRVIFIKRGTKYAGAKPNAYVCHVAPESSSLERIAIHNAADLLDIDLRPVVEGRLGTGDAVEELLYLVCTHGRHDACCSIRGNPVSRRLCEMFPGRAWEASHIGGDRFAANIVCLPLGVYLGRVRVEELERLTAELEAGRIDLDRYRGRCCYPFPTQAAEYFVRREEGLLDLDSVALKSSTRIDSGTLEATFLAGGRQVTVRVGIEADADAYHLTCKAHAVHRPPRYKLLSLTAGS